MKMSKKTLECLWLFLINLSTEDYCMREEEILVLKNIKGIGDTAISRLITYLQDLGGQSLLKIDISTLVNNPIFSRYKKAFQAISPNEISEESVVRAQEILKKLKKKNITVIGITNSRYPKQLKLIKSPPVLLFCKGNINLLSTNKNVAVVGTRENTKRGELIAIKSTHFLVSNGYTIVSGLALGIDAIAHKESLNCNGNTIAVLVDVENIQPKKNRSLADEIYLNSGLLISENIPGTNITPPLFVKRDRIQTGLSLAVFPIETSINGGTMHAVRAAEQENRFIFIPDHTQSGYKNKNIDQLSGIIELHSRDSVIPYTKSSYPEIILNLQQKEKDLAFPSKDQGTLF